MVSPQDLVAPRRRSYSALSLNCPTWSAVCIPHSLYCFYLILLILLVSIKFQTHKSSSIDACFVNHGFFLNRSCYFWDTSCPLKSPHCPSLSSPPATHANRCGVCPPEQCPQRGFPAVSGSGIRTGSSLSLLQCLGPHLKDLSPEAGNF